MLRLLIIFAILAPNLADLLHPAQIALAARPEVEHGKTQNTVNTTYAMLPGNQMQPQHGLTGWLDKLEDQAVSDVLQVEPAEVQLQCSKVDGYPEDGECLDHDPHRVVEAHLDDMTWHAASSEFDSICSDSTYTCTAETITVYLEWGCVGTVDGSGDIPYEFHLDTPAQPYQETFQGVFCTAPLNGTCSGDADVRVVRTFEANLNNNLDIEIAMGTSVGQDQTPETLSCSWRASLDGFSQAAAQPRWDYSWAPESACLVNYRDPYIDGLTDTRSGNLSYQATDISLPALGTPLAFERSYNSQDLAVGPMGQGWTHSYNMHLAFETAGINGTAAVLTAPHGSQIRFLDPDGDGEYSAEPGVRATLDYNAGLYSVTLGNQVQYLFDAAGRLNSLADSYGRLTTMSYNEDGLLSQITAPDGRFLTLGYTEMAYGRVLTSVSDPEARQATYTYSETQPLLIGMTDLSGRQVGYTYAAEGNFLTQIADNQGVILEAAYDLAGRVLTQTLPENGATIFTYVDGYGTLIAANEITTTHLYSGLLSGVIDGLSNPPTYYEYDERYNLISATDPSGHPMQYDWNASGCAPAVITDTYGFTTAMSYGDLNNLTSVTDPLGNTTHYTYSGALLTSSQDALQNLTQYAYTTGGTEPAGLLKEMLDPLGRLTSYTYDQHGQLISTTNPAGQTTTYTYDALGRRLTTTYPGGRADWSCYDAAGRVVRSVANASGANPCDPNYIPNGDPAYDRITTTAYDLRGNVIATIDAVGL